MRLLKYSIKNVMGVKDITLDVDGHHLFLVGGKNAQGKTSALTALLMALCGKRGLKEYPEIALRDGESRGSVTVELSGDPSLHEDEKITVELGLRRKRTGVVVEEFRVVESSGEEAPEPRELLKRLFSLRAFDPLEFERAKPKEQVDIIRGMLGIDFEDFDRRRQEIFDKRRDCGIEGKQLAGQLEGTTKHKDAPEKEVSAKDLMAELQRRQWINQHRADLERTVQLQKDEIVHAEERVTSCHSEIERLKDLILAEEEKIKKYHSDITGAKELIGKCEADLSSGEFEPQNVEEIKEQIDGVDEANRKFRENKQHKELAAKVEAARAEYARMTKEIEKIDEEKAEAVRTAPWPVPDMELTEDGLLLNGLPFKQGSTSQRILASTYVGMALNPTLRLLVCQHGSDLDVDFLDALQQVLEDNEFQMIVEMVSRTQADEDMCAVVIEDGMVKGSV